MTSHRPVIVTLEEFLNQELPPRQMLLSPWLPRQGLAMVHAYRGIGKTHVALAVGYAVSSGTSFLGWKAPSPEGVLLLDGEMPGPALQECLASIVANAEKEPSAPFLIMTPGMQPIERPAFNLAREEDQLTRESSLTGISLIVVDNLAALCRTGQTNDADSWLPVQEWARRQRTAGRSVLFIHHSGKTGAQRGTSAKEDVLDTVLGLRRPSDYSNAQGPRFEIHFEKARGFAGSDSEFSICREEKETKLLEALADACNGLSIIPLEVKEALAPEDTEDWCKGAISDETLTAFARSLVQRREMDQGKRPAHYTEHASCKHCGPIWLWFSGDLLGCPWCWNRVADKPIPRPDSVQCGDCVHFERIDHPHLGHCLRDEPKAIAGLWDSDRRHCERYLPTIQKGNE